MIKYTYGDDMEDNTKKLGLILCGIVLIVVIILIIYFCTYLFNVDTDKPVITTTATTQKADYGFKTLSESKMREFNNYFNNDILLIALNNAFDNDYSIKNINLFETEISKFKFLYTYIKLVNPEQQIDYSFINNYSQNYFAADLYETNFTSYLVDGFYQYEIKHSEISYCLKATKEKADAIFIDMVPKTEQNCSINFYQYDESTVIHTFELKYEKKDSNYIYKSFVVVK